MSIKTYRDMKVWQQAHAFVLSVYDVTRSFPSDEKFGLTSQLRRAAISVPSNIVEGFRRYGQNDKARFYNIAAASLDEVNYQLLLAKELGYLGAEAHEELDGQYDNIARMLNHLTSQVKNTVREEPAIYVA